MSRLSLSKNNKITTLSDFKQFSSSFGSRTIKQPERTFPNSLNSFNKNLEVVTFSEEKTIFIQLENKKTYEIKYKTDEEKKLNVQWLLDEAIKKIEQNSNIKDVPFEKKILFLMTKDRNYNLDHWLTFMEKSIEVIKDGQILTPFYSDLNYEINDKTDINPNYFHFLKSIGTGGFSDVFLVRRKDNGLFYAIKVIDKDNIIKKKKEKTISNERNIWKKLNNKFIVKLFCSFQNKEKLFFVTEYCSGGELFFHLQRKQKLQEEDCKSLVYQVIQAIEYLHSNLIIYRDLKPENILLDINGNVKLTDFGLSKELSSPKQLTYSFCGSQEYLSPEMLNKSGHSLTLDFYCLGVFIYELVAGFPPALEQKKTTVFSDFFKTDINFPNHFSLDLKSLITRLMDKNPKKRLGAQEGVHEILDHEWFSSLMMTKKIRNFKSPFSLSVYRFYVEKEIQTKEVPLNFSDSNAQNFDNNSPKMDSKFKDFYFVSEEFVAKKKICNSGKSLWIPLPTNKPLDFLRGDINDYVEIPSAANLN